MPGTKPSSHASLSGPRERKKKMRAMLHWDGKAINWPMGRRAKQVKEGEKTEEKPNEGCLWGETTRPG
jgi:hypothetical protein